MSKRYPGGLITKTPVTPSGSYQTSSAPGVWTLEQQAQYAKQGIWPTAGNLVPTTDPQFNYVTMLLHGDGTNGAQNNTFVDGSSNNFGITRNGNTTQGTFTPYGDNWSNAFTTSSGSYLSFPYSSAFNLTGDFTVECWINPSQLPTATNVGSPLYGRIFSFGTYDGLNSLGLEINSNDPGRLNAFSVWYNGTQYYSANSIVAVGTWYHCAVVRNGTVITVYLNGTSVLTITGASAAVNRNQAFYIASLQSYESVADACFKGNISNFRIVKGTAVYTSTFTPPTSPLTAIANTTLLTCQSNRFVDNSTPASTVTINGTPSVERFNPFGTSTAYSTSVIGGSGYFDGNGDYLLSASTTAMNLGTGNFSVEMWFYATSTSGTYNGLCGSQTDYKGPSISRFGSVLMYGLSSNGSSWNVLAAEGSTGSTTIKANQWYHVALCRTGTTISAFVNGSRDITTTSSASLVSRTEGFAVGTWFPSVYGWLGYISGFRFVVGSSAYDATQTTITVPTAPPTAITNTQLLCNMTNGAIFDNAMMNDLETVGNAQISTSVVKYGTGSLAFDGTGDYLVSPTTTQFNPRQPFTVEFWTYPNSTTAVAWINGNSSLFYIETLSGTLYVGDGTSNIILASPPSTSAWTHVALSFDGTTYRLFYNGTSQATSTSLLASNVLTAWYIGAKSDGSRPFNGYIDDLRITKGYARYTANFTPPTAAFFNIGPN